MPGIKVGKIGMLSTGKSIKILRNNRDVCYEILISFQINHAMGVA